MQHEKAIQFEHSVQEGEYLVMVSGTDELVGQAYFILQQTNPTHLEMFNAAETGEPA